MLPPPPPPLPPLLPLLPLEAKEGRIDAAKNSCPADFQEPTKKDSLTTGNKEEDVILLVVD